jgi:hypothetical protein
MSGRDSDADYARAAMAQAQPNGLVISDWESITPLWYAQYVLGLNRSTRTTMETAVPGSDTWPIAVQSGLERRPVSLAQWIPGLGDKYRQFPVGTLFDIPQRTLQERGQFGLLSSDSALRLLGYQLDRPAARPGELVRLTLYQKTDRGRDEPYWPVLRLASDPPVEFRFDGAQRYPLPTWSDNEVIGEVYEFSVPSWVRPGPLPLELAYRVPGRDALVGLSGGDPWARIGSLDVQPFAPPTVAPPPETVVNFANQFVLRGGRLKDATQADLATPPVGARLARGSMLDLETRWSALRWMDQSYTLFVHLLDAQYRLVAQQDALPLGGIYHTYKWVPGQVITDWYRLPLAPDLPPGEYWIEIGAYHAVTQRRLPILDGAGGSDHTSFLWGPVRIE